MHIATFVNRPAFTLNGRWLAWLGLSCCLSISQGLAAATAAEPEKQRNVLLICVDDLRPELNCFGKSYIHSPNIDALAAEGRVFRQHFVQAPTCGASRYTLLTGRYGGSSNEALFQRAKQIASGKPVPPSMPAWFRNHGYTTVSVGKVSHHPGGRGGADWDDDEQPEMPDSWDRHLLPAGAWQHPRGWMHGLAHGEIRVKAEEMDVFQAAPGDDSIYPDGTTIPEALHQLEILTEDPQVPFFLAVGILRPHLPFGAPASYLEPYSERQLPEIPHPNKPAFRTTWHGSGEFMKYNRWGRNPNTDPDFATDVRRHYAACVSYADAQVGKLVAALKQRGVWENTIVILWGDHGWHLGEHAVWGKHTLFEESLRSPLIIRVPDMANQGVHTDALTESVDIFPTLCELTRLPMPTDLPGTSLVAALSDPAVSGDPAISYFTKAQTIRTKDYRLIVHDDGYTELYSHAVDSPGEVVNLADELPGVVRALRVQLNRKLGSSKR